MNSLVIHYVLYILYGACYNSAGQHEAYGAESKNPSDPCCMPYNNEALLLRAMPHPKGFLLRSIQPKLPAQWHCV